MDECLDSEDPAIEALEKHIDQLGPDVLGIHVSSQNDLISVSTNDPEQDKNHCPYYPPLQELQLPDGLQVLKRTELQELDRFGPMVDLVTYPPSSKDARKKVSQLKFNLSLPGLLFFSR